MKIRFAWNTEREIAVIPGNYFESAVLSEDMVCPDTAGRDQFLSGGRILTGKRLSGSGRSQCYAGSGNIETADSLWVPLNEKTAALSFGIHTDMFLGQGLLAAGLELILSTEDGETTHIPLNRPDVKIAWPSRGNFLVTVLLNQ